MGVIPLSPAEEDLVAAVEHGDKLRFENEEEITAEVLRHIVIGLPLIKKGFGPLAHGIVCATTGAGVSISGAIIRKRVKLDAAIGADGGPLYPLQFHRCTFLGGFSGAHAHFSRLSFRDCLFQDGAEKGDETENEGGKRGNSAGPLPSIDLSGATIDSDLDMQGIRADGDELEGAAADADYFDERAERKEHHCWIRLVGTRIDGKLDLSRARLRAPPDRSDRWHSVPGVNALDLSQARVNGDVRFLNGCRARGRIMAPSVHIKGDMWLSGAKLNGVDRDALVLQLATINGVLVMESRRDNVGSEGPARTFCARGGLYFLDLRLGSSLRIVDAEILPSSKNPEDPTDGNQNRPSLCLSGARIRGRMDVVGSSLARPLIASPLLCEGDVVLHGEVDGDVQLGGSTIGGSLDISELRIGRDRAKLSLEDGNIGRTLRLVSGTGCRFDFKGTVNLRGLTCDTLDDHVGRCWGAGARIHMNHFTYRRTGWLPEDPGKKQSYRFVGDWVLAKRAEGRGLWGWLRNSQRLQRDDYWAPWQLRRNWIYQQFYIPNRNPVAVSRHRIDERDYRPQPFEQAIRVARAEGREDFATQFEIHKHEIEWRLFNRQVRWWLAVAAIVLASLWVIIKDYTWFWFSWIFLALIFTVYFVVYGSRTRKWIKRKTTYALGRIKSAAASSENNKPKYVSWSDRKRIYKYVDNASVWGTWLSYVLPAVILYGVGWRERPLHFVVALIIFLCIRMISRIAHTVMRIGFGYLRRPMNAIGTLMGAFVVGWWGVHLANDRHMLVVDAEPVASLAAIEGHQGGERIMMGSENAANRKGFVRDVSCLPTVSEPLYALDVLIPLIDLREESRCEIRRVAEPPSQPRHGAAEAAARSVGPRGARRYNEPGDTPPRSDEIRGLRDLIDAVPAMTINSNSFWILMKALYALAGWFIVSLSILTFAQANRMHAEPPMEHK